MRVILIIWILAVLVQEVVPGTISRHPRNAHLTEETEATGVAVKESSNDEIEKHSSVKTEYEAQYRQKGYHGNETFSKVVGNQEIVHNNCADNWNDFAERCATLIKDLVASLANAISSNPGDTTNLQLQIKNSFRHFDSTNNCSCFNHAKSNFTKIEVPAIMNKEPVVAEEPTHNAVPQETTNFKETEETVQDTSGSEGIPSRSTDQTDQISGRHPRPPYVQPPTSIENSGNDFNTPPRVVPTSSSSELPNDSGMEQQPSIVTPAKASPDMATIHPEIQNKVPDPGTPSQPQSTPTSSENTKYPYEYVAEHPAPSASEGMAPQAVPSGKYESLPTDTHPSGNTSTKDTVPSQMSESKPEVAAEKYEPTRQPIESDTTLFKEEILSPVLQNKPKNSEISGTIVAAPQSSTDTIGHTNDEDCESVESEKPVIFNSQQVPDTTNLQHEQPITKEQTNIGIPEESGQPSSMAAIPPSVTQNGLPTHQVEPQRPISEPAETINREVPESRVNQNEPLPQYPSNDQQPLRQIPVQKEEAAVPEDVIITPRPQNNGESFVQSPNVQNSGEFPISPNQEDMGEMQSIKNPVSTEDRGIKYDQPETQNIQAKPHEQEEYLPNQQTSVVAEKPKISENEYETPDCSDEQTGGTQQAQKISKVPTEEMIISPLPNQNPSEPSNTAPMDSEYIAENPEVPLQGQSHTEDRRPTELSSHNLPKASESSDVQYPAADLEQIQNSDTVPLATLPKVPPSQPIRENNLPSQIQYPAEPPPTENLPNDSTAHESISTDQQRPLESGIDEQLMDAPVKQNKEYPTEEQQTIPILEESKEGERSLAQNFGSTEDVPASIPQAYYPVEPTAPPHESAKSPISRPYRPSGQPSVVPVQQAPDSHSEGRTLQKTSPDTNPSETIPTEGQTFAKDSPQNYNNNEDLGSVQRPAIVTQENPDIVERQPVTNPPNYQESAVPEDHAKVSDTAHTHGAPAQVKEIDAPTSVTESENIPEFDKPQTQPIASQPSSRSQPGTDLAQFSEPQTDNAVAVSPSHAGTSENVPHIGPGSPTSNAVPGPGISEYDSDENEEFEGTVPQKATTFQTTSVEPTSPRTYNPAPPSESQAPSSPPKALLFDKPGDQTQQIHDAPPLLVPHSHQQTSPTSTEAASDDDSEGDDDEECCSCESCTEEELSNPQLVRNTACKDLEEARRELKAIFDKIRKKLKCGRKAPKAIIASSTPLAT